MNKNNKLVIAIVAAIVAAVAAVLAAGSLEVTFMGHTSTIFGNIEARGFIRGGDVITLGWVAICCGGLAAAAVEELL